MAISITDEEWDALAPENFDTTALLRTVDAIDKMGIFAQRPEKEHSSRRAERSPGNTSLAGPAYDPRHSGFTDAVKSRHVGAGLAA